MTMPHPPSHLRQQITDHFSKEELRTLCFDFELDYDVLGDRSRSANVRELITYMNRRGRLLELVDICRQLRPSVNWSDPPPSSNEQISLPQNDTAQGDGRSVSGHSPHINPPPEGGRKLSPLRVRGRGRDQIRRSLQLIAILTVVGFTILIIAFAIQQTIQISENKSQETPIASSQSLPPQEVVPTSTQILNTPSPTLIPIPTLTPVPTPTFSPDFTDGYTPTQKAVNGYQYVLVPAGLFGDGGEVAQIPEFWIGLYEVTNSQFADFLNARGNNCRGGQLCLDDKDIDVHIRIAGRQWQVDDGYENHPIIEVTWLGASDFCEDIGGRLPHWWEWTKAASWHPDTEQVATYPWGEYPPNEQLANYNSIYQGTLEVSRFEQGRSVIGAFNMSGNVWEFVAATSTISTNRNWRGGAWDSPVNDIDILSMRQGSITTSNDNLGFRCAMD